MRGSAIHTKTPNSPDGLSLVRVVFLLCVRKQRVNKDCVTQICKIKTSTLLIVKLQQQNKRVVLGWLLLLKNGDCVNLLADSTPHFH
jgi:hypothetical protein